VLLDMKLRDESTWLVWCWCSQCWEAKTNVQSIHLRKCVLQILILCCADLTSIHLARLAMFSLMMVMAGEMWGEGGWMNVKTERRTMREARSRKKKLLIRIFIHHDPSTFFFLVVSFSSYFFFPLFYFLGNIKMRLTFMVVFFTIYNAQSQRKENFRVLIKKRLWRSVRWSEYICTQKKKSNLNLNLWIFLMSKIYL
jgi:hypothetical protein